MKLLLLASLVLLSVVPRTAYSDEEDSDCVLGEEGCPDREENASESSAGTVDLIAILTDDDIQEAIRREDMMVVIFYAPW